MTSAPGGSLYPGLEASGVVEEVGQDVRGWKVGDEACALLVGGGYAEKVNVPAGQVRKRARATFRGCMCKCLLVEGKLCLIVVNQLPSAERTRRSRHLNFGVCYIRLFQPTCWYNEIEKLNADCVLS